MDLNIPKEVREIGGILLKAGHKAYLVGGSVRDILLGREPKDWDIATDALPEKTQEIFVSYGGREEADPATVYENNFGTVGIKTKSEDSRLKVIEVTTFRIEGKYSDKRHPDSVSFTKTIEEDLSRRDFTINAIALDLSLFSGGDIRPALIDPYGGLKDLEAGVLRTVGKPEDRFEEDAIRILRAVRFSAELGFQPEALTNRAVQEKASLLGYVSSERIRDEFEKMIMSPRAAMGVRFLESSGLLKYVLPELCESVGVEQNLHHIYNVFDHCVNALAYTAEKEYDLEIRLAALLHDIGKPRTKGGEGRLATFYNHEMVGARMAQKTLERLKFSREVIDRTVHLVRWHMFYYNVDEVSEAGVRRFLKRVGPENIDDLIKLREADRIGSGVPKAVPYKLRHLLFMIEKVKHDPISPKMLKFNGEDLMGLLGITPGPRVGKILNALLEDVLDDPSRNTKEYLERRSMELGAMSEEELDVLAKKARESALQAEDKAEADIKKQFNVQ